MKVIAVFHYDVFGGPQNQLLRLAIPLRERGVNYVGVLPPGPAAAKLAAASVEVETINLGRVRLGRNVRLHMEWVARFPLDIWNLVRTFRRQQPDVVQLTSLVNLQGAIAARLLGIPVVWQLVDTFPPVVIRRLMMVLIRRLADAIMPIGHLIGAAHPGAESFSDRMVIFYPPVDTELFRPKHEAAGSLRQELAISVNAPIVGVIGNINPQKGHEFFVDAAALVHKRFPGARFVVVGSILPNHRQYYESLLARARSRGLLPGQDIFYLGAREDIPEVLAAFDIFALASVPNSEGTPTVILEAMSCGVPVVASDVGSVCEVVADGETGYVTPSMKPEQMAQRLEELLCDPDKRKLFGDRARQRVENRFSLANCADVHIEAFKLAIEHRRGKRRK